MLKFILPKQIKQRNVVIGRKQRGFSFKSKTSRDIINSSILIYTHVTPADIMYNVWRMGISLNILGAYLEVVQQIMHVYGDVS